MIAGTTLCLILSLTVTISEAYKTCYEGFTLSKNGMCIQEVSEEPRFVCPAGTLEGKGCKVQIPKVRRCSEKYTLDNTGGCSYLVPTEVQYFCPSGFEDNGDSCVKSIPGELTNYCEEPSEPVNDQCLVLHRSPPILISSCPTDSYEHDGKCYKKTESFECFNECQNKQQPLTCEKRAKNNNVILVPNSSYNLRTLDTAEEDVYSTSTRELTPTVGNKTENLVPASPPRHYETLIVSQQCIRRYEVEPIQKHGCPDNYHIDSKGCFSQETVPMKTKCLATGGPPEHCPHTVSTIQKLARCTDGSPAVKGKCFEIVKGEMLEYCPNGYLEGNDGLCEGFLEPQTKCLKDLVLRNGKCIGKRIQQPIIIDDPISDGASRTHLKELKDLFNPKIKQHLNPS